MVGGVEVILRQQAGLMAKAGHEVSVICGSGRQFSPNIKTVVLEDLNIASPSVTAAQAELWNGYPAAGYFAVVQKLREQLTRVLKNMDCVIVHNLMTMPFHLAATQVLIELAESGTKMLAWTHDLAASNQDYSLPRNGIVDMIREKHSSIRYVAVSQTRADEFEELTGHRVEAIIPNGMDQATVLGLTPEVEGLVNQLDSQATIFLYPTRILARKNLGFAIQILNALNELGHNAYLLITGAANQYNAGAEAHLSGLKQQAADLAMTDRIIWVNERFQVDEQQLRSLYLAADALLFSTRQEGFGLPLLEAAAFRLPIFCSDIEPLRSNLADNVVKFDLRASPRNIGETISQALKTDLAFASRKRLLMNHSAQTLYREKTEPLLRSLS